MAADLTAEDDPPKRLLSRDDTLLGRRPQAKPAALVANRKTQRRRQLSPKAARGRNPELKSGLSDR